MNYYRIADRFTSDFFYACADSDLELIKKYELYTRENNSKRLIQLDGEQLALAIDYFNNQEGE